MKMANPSLKLKAVELTNAEFLSDSRQAKSVP